jgi:hypothetical protein
MPFLSTNFTFFQLPPFWNVRALVLVSSFARRPRPLPLPGREPYQLSRTFVASLPTGWGCAVQPPGAKHFLTRRA